MQFQLKLNLGDTEINIMDTAETPVDFIEKVSFFSELPKVGPNGETDLCFKYRTTKDGHKYYSIVSEKAGQEFAFGLLKKIEGGLFPKGWQPVYNAGGASNSDVAGIDTGSDSVPTPSTVQAPLPASNAKTNQDVLSQFGIG